MAQGFGYVRSGPHTSGIEGAGRSPLTWAIASGLARSRSRPRISGDQRSLKCVCGERGGVLDSRGLTTQRSLTTN